MPSDLRKPKGLRTARLLILSLCLVTAGDVSIAAQEDPNQRLEEIEKEINDAREKKEELNREAEKTAKSAEKTRKDLVQIANEVQAHESRMTSLERQLDALLSQEEILNAELQIKAAALTDTLAALQTMQRNPPPAILVHPDDAGKAARGAILLGEVAPLIKSQADELSQQLAQLDQLRQDILEQRKELDLAGAALRKKQDKLNKLLSEREEKYASLRDKAKGEESRVSKLAGEARDVEELIAALTAFALKSLPKPKPEQVVPDAPRPQTRPEMSGIAKATPLTGNELIALAIPSRTGGDSPFSMSRGKIRLPANGILVAEYGQKTRIGETSKGVSIATRPNAQIVAPFDGKIVFAGPYLGYGELLIIEVGEGYHLVIAGMSRINGIVGQRLLAGEPIGAMGNQAATKATKEDRKGRTSDWPKLYFEFRKDGKPFDPMPWLAVRQRKVSG